MRRFEVNDDPEAYKQSFDHLFLHSGQEGIKAFEEMMESLTNELIDFHMQQTQPYSGKSPAEIERELKRLKPVSEQGESFSLYLKELEETVLSNSLHVTHTNAIGHLHCPPLLPTLAAELIIAMFNQSMDSWDQSPSASFVEEKMIQWLTQQFNLKAGSSGTFSSGGTQSNYIGLLLARDSYCEKKFNHNVQKKGLPPQSNKLKILCSKEAHFTVIKSASQLGLGEEAVVKVETDEDHRLSLQDLEEKFNQLRQNGEFPFALVATCGTTDFGSIDPLEDLAVFSKENELWYHVDAAFGGALILSDSHCDKLTGIERADSIAVDFHKLFYQPISCGAFLLKDENNFKYLNHHADYLNPKEDKEEGIPHLVNKTIATSRRFDALKLWTSLRVVGTKKFQEMIDHTFVIAKQSADLIDEMEDIEGANRYPELNTVLFRFNSKEGPIKELDEINKQIQQRLLYKGTAFVAKTKVNKEVYLKLTILNPRTSLSDVTGILQEIRRLGTEEIEYRRVTI
ncbi:L-2,4-diaminobutyrate decarboxylase [Halobacillus andaensis]|uniref:L-2,4-diaminobutyrate decarboxylase n=1 Tax=Halobacillus andaensis TaxID=1176239 RepID=A0A917BB49_HALAA|nr:aspartate aminotransferase family protein [Halobacillus andaensis]MBP2005509.1 L-2,4-diaminobutyrate decarboxylase [Halobacillus andaensis]GGF32047.1 L-2,4-diaminobutyrate decarboxylase [Halobacillus andaensis]